MSDDDKAFIRQYAAEIASALRAQEEGTGSVVPSVEDSTQALYRALCFDEPVVEDIPHLATAASALCRQLTIPSSDYALSNRLVNGIVYLCRRQQGHTTAESHAVGNDASTISNGNHHPSATTAVILAKLVFCVLVQVPLECCQGLLYNDLSTLQRFLGSYKGNVDMRSDEILETTTTDHEVTQLVHALSSGGTMDDDHLPDHHENHHPTSALNPESQETSSWQEEVWAAESDPSDYDYNENEGEGDGHNVLRSPSLPVAVDVVDLLDPIVLSRPDPQRTLEGARGAIGSLLQQANYSLMAPIFQMPKKQVEAYTAQLTQLLLLILQPPRSILSESEDHDSASSSLQNVMLTPLWILRDAALHHPPSHDQSSFAAVTYLEVIQTLLAIDQAYQADISTTSPQQQQHPPHSSNPLCSASIVGLSALSSWCCCSAQIPRSVTMTAIVDAMNDMAYVMERAVETGYRKHLQHSIPPIIEILIGMTFDDRISRDGSTGGGNTMVCQTLLNSGLLRQLLVLSLDRNKNRDGEDDESPPYYLDHAIWGLCVSYPTVVGKYVARYPGFPSIVRRYSPPTPRTGSSRDCVQSILWNSFAYLQCVVDGSTTPKMVWKSRGSSGVTPLVPLLTKDECQEVCQKSWIQLCTMVQSSLLSSKDASISPKQWLDIVKDWERLLTFVGIPSVAPTFQSLMMTNYDDQLSRILEDLTTATTDAANAEASDGHTPKEKREDDDDVDPKKSSMSHQELIVATTRKTLKQYALFFQGSARSSSKTD